ncbi:alanine--tRNA ligase-related protein [Cupriavidus basilensis]
MKAAATCCAVSSAAPSATATSWAEKTPFFHKLVADLVAQMGEAYPKLAEAESRVVEVLKAEEERFFETIENGMSILDAALADIKLKGGKVLDGELAFKLHDTFGFPLDLTQDVCREQELTVDEAAFDAAMNRQREQARAAGKFKMAAGLEYKGDKTTFHGYEKLGVDGAKITALYVDGAAVDTMQPGQTGVVVLDNTPFYAESGGQAGDQGELKNGDAVFTVSDTTKVQADVFGHHGSTLAGGAAQGGRQRHRARSTRSAARAPCATTRPPT